MLVVHSVELQLDELQDELLQLEEFQSALALQLEELQDELLQLDELQDELLQLDESHFDAIVEPVRHEPPGAQTSAGKPWLARPGVPA
jgi:hypothetical protein